MNSFVPELLCPAGSLEKLKVAINYGADAVYLGGENFGLRQAADNFTNDELAQAVLFAKSKKVKVYVVLNSFVHDDEFLKLDEFVCFLDQVGVDALIVSDLGVIKKIRQLSKINIHLSTQASCLNLYGAKLWKKMGVSRIILGREVSISDAGMIKEQTGLEIELFIHGAMCMAYSGHCTISNYTAGRDSNRGGCAQSCRFEYDLQTQNKSQKSYFMSSKDLEGIRLLPLFVEHKIDSIKIEGRMRSHLYAATVSKIYSDALNDLKKNRHLSEQLLEKYSHELNKFIHRDYCSGNLLHTAQADSIFQEREFSNKSKYKVIGHVLENIKDKYTVLEVRNAFNRGDSLEFLPTSGETIKFKADEIHSLDDHPLERTRPSTIVKIPYIDNLERWNIARAEI